MAACVLSWADAEEAARGSEASFSNCTRCQEHSFQGNRPCKNFPTVVAYVTDISQFLNDKPLRCSFKSKGCFELMSGLALAWTIVWSKLTRRMFNGCALYNHKLNAGLSC